MGRPFQIELYETLLDDVSIDHIVVPDHLKRIASDEQADDLLFESVSQLGLKQPLAVAPMGDGKFELRSGTRRLQALKRANIDKAMVLILPKNDVSAVGLLESMCRKDLDPLDEARQLAALAESQSLSHAQLAKLYGVARNTITQRLCLLKIDDQTAGELAKMGKSASRDTLIALARANPKERPRIIEALKRGAKRDQIRAARKSKAGLQTTSLQDRLTAARSLKSLLTKLKRGQLQGGDQQSLRKLRGKLVALVDRIDALLGDRPVVPMSAGGHELHS